MHEDSVLATTVGLQCHEDGASVDSSCRGCHHASGRHPGGALVSLQECLCDNQVVSATARHGLLGCCWDRNVRAGVLKWSKSVISQAHCGTDEGIRLPGLCCTPLEGFRSLGRFRVAGSDRKCHQAATASCKEWLIIHSPLLSAQTMHCAESILALPGRLIPGCPLRAGRGAPRAASRHSRRASATHDAHRNPPNRGHRLVEDRRRRRGAAERSGRAAGSPSSQGGSLSPPGANDERGSSSAPRTHQEGQVNRPRRPQPRRRRRRVEGRGGRGREVRVVAQQQRVRPRPPPCHAR